MKVIKEFRKKDAIKAKLICSHLSLFLKLLVIKEEIVFRVKAEFDRGIMNMNIMYLQQG